MLLCAALLPPCPGWQGGGGTEAAPSSKGLLEVFTPSLAPYKWEKGIPEHFAPGNPPTASSSRDGAPSSRGR